MVALNKRQLRREIEKARRAQVKGRLLELKEEIRKARDDRREAIRAVQLDCKMKREELRQSCGLRRARARESGGQEVERRRVELDEEKKYEGQIRAADRPRRLRSTRRERGQESDDEVRSNIPADMVRVFDAVRKHIKGNTRKSRSEAFMEWAEENPGEVYELQQRDADRYLAQLLAEQERAQRELRRSSVSGVPF
jgi:hypothetical protein